MPRIVARLAIHENPPSAELLELCPAAPAAEWRVHGPIHG